MQGQPFMFNPSQLECPRSAKQTNSFRNEILKNELLQNDKISRNQRLMNQTVCKEQEPLLLSSAVNMKTHQEQGSKAMKSGERLTGLHSQLYQQTEKLKQWKISTEMQINDKDRKIAEASKTIESLRKSILELQFLNESVSSKLHEEKTLQDETVQKITTTRNMCNALKEHLVKLEKGVLIGENMLETQRQHTQLTVNQYEELALRFQELEIRVTGKEHELEKEAMRNQNEYKGKIEELMQKLDESTEQTTSMRQMNQQYEAEVVGINQELKIAKEEVEKLKRNCLYLQEQINQAEEAVKEKVILLQEEKNQNTNLKQECLELEQKYTVQVTNLESACNERDQELRIQEKDILDKRESMFRAENKLKQLSDTIEAKNLEVEELGEKISELESIKVRLESDITEQTTKSTGLEETIKELQKSVAMRKDIEYELKQIAENERDTTRKLKEEIQELEGYKDQAEKDRTAMEELNEKVRELETSKEELQFQANLTLSQMEQLTSELQKQGDENQSLVEQLAVKNSELQECQVKNESVEKDIEEAKKKVEEQSKELDVKNNELNDLQTKLNEVSLERANNQGVLEEVMDSRDKKTAGFEKKIKNLEEKASAKSKQISKLQLDIKSLRGQLKKEEKLTAKQESVIATTKKQLDMLEKEKKDGLEELQGRETNLMNELQKTQVLAYQNEQQAEVMKLEMERLKNQAETSEKLNEKAQDELRVAKQSFDSQIAEMCNTLEKYKVENEKLMNAKEKELDMRTSDILASNKMLQETVKAKEFEIKKSKEECSENELKIEQLKKQIHELKTKVSSLEVENDKNDRSDVEMAEMEEKQRSTKETDTQINTRVNLARRSPHLSNSFVNRLNTTPHTSTPKSNPEALPRTPHSILKSCEERPAKAKHVIFSFDDSGDEEDPLLRKKRSSDAFDQVKLPNKIIPVKPTIRASPKLNTTATPKGKKNDKCKVLETPGKRAKCAGKDEQTSDEIDKFKMLYPDEEDGLKVKKLKDKNGAKKTAFKSKIKKVMPRAKKHSAEEKMDLMWFDTDSVFGFGMEE